MARSSSRTPAKSMPTTRSKSPSAKAAAKSRATVTYASPPPKRTSQRKRAESDSGAVSDGLLASVRKRVKALIAVDRTTLAIRAVYIWLLLTAFWIFWQPRAALKYFGDGPSRDITLARSLALALIGIALQHIAVVQGSHDTQKRALQYGMFTWLGAAIFSIHTQHVMGNSFKAAPLFVAVDLFFFSFSLAACYYV